jgi:hypothetical protein
MFGIFGLAECVNLLLAYDGTHGSARYGHDAANDALGRRVVERVAELVAQRPMPYCEGGNGFCYLHSQSGIDLDNDVTAGTRIPVGDEPGMREHITPARRITGTSRRASATSSTSTRQRCATPGHGRHHPRAPSPVGMRDFTFNLDDNEFIRITGYLVRKSDLVGIDDGRGPAMAATTSRPGPSARSTSPTAPSSEWGP